MKINFTKAQYKNLLKLVYLGHYMADPIKSFTSGDPEIEALQQYIYSFHKDFDLKEDFNTEDDYIFWGNEEVFEMTDEYDNHNFWSELTFRLVLRDLDKKFPEGANDKNEANYIAEEERLTAVYDQSFSQHNLAELFLSGPRI